MGRILCAIGVWLAFGISAVAQGADRASQRRNSATARIRVGNAKFGTAVADRVTSPDTGSASYCHGFANDRAAERAALRKHIVRLGDLHSARRAGPDANHRTALVCIALQAQRLAGSNRYHSDCFRRIGFRLR